MLCHIQKHTKIHMYSTRDKKETWLVIWWYYGRWLAFVPCACAYVYVVCMNVRTGVVAIYSTLIVPSNNDPADWILLSNSTKNSWNIYKFASYLWFKKSHNNREAIYLKVFSIEVPPCITAIVTSHKQKKDVSNGTTNDFPSIHFPSPVGSLK